MIPRLYYGRIVIFVSGVLNTLQVILICKQSLRTITLKRLVMTCHWHSPPMTLEMVTNVSLVHPPDMSPCPHSPLWSRLGRGEGGSLTGWLPGFFLLLVTTSSHTIQENHFRRTLCPLRFTLEGGKPKKRTVRRREWTDYSLDGLSTERKEQGVKWEGCGSVIYREKKNLLIQMAKIYFSYVRIWSSSRGPGPAPQTLGIS